MKEKKLKLIKEFLLNGLKQSKGYKKIAKEIQTEIDIDKENLLTKAQTEGHRIQSLEREDRYKETIASAEKLGYTTTKIWQSVNDERTRPDHLIMDGVEADEDEIFHLPSGATCKSPGNTGNPADDDGCRCVSVLQIDGLSDQIGNKSWDTFKDWKRKKRDIE